MLAHLERFLSEHESEYSQETIEKYGRSLLDLASWLEQNQIDNPNQVSSKHLRDWLASKSTWGQSSRHVALSACRSFFRWAIGKSNSPAELIPLPKRVVKPQRTLTAAQIERLLEPLDTSRPKGVRDLALIALLIDSGLRSSEICRLETEHLDLDERTLVVQVKGGRFEKGVFSAYTASTLESWLSVRPKYARGSARTVFVSVGGGKPGSPLTRYGLQSNLRKLGEAAGIGPISPHDFRRSFATLALRSGAPTRVVQVAGRWRDLGMVEVYSQAITPEDFEPYFPMNGIMGLRPGAD